MASSKPRLGTLAVDGETLYWIDQRSVGAESRLETLRRLLGITVRDSASRLQEYVRGPEFLALPTATARYLELLGFLYRQDPEAFTRCALQIRKRKRIYFSKSRLEIEGSGRSPQARRVPGARMFALTNIRGDRKHAILLQILGALKFLPSMGIWVRRNINAGLRDRASRRPSKRGP